MVRAVELGFPQREIAESSFRFQQVRERKEKIIVYGEYREPAII